MEASEDWQSGRCFEETNLYMLDNRLGSDITLIVGQDKQRILAHKFILASRSMVFYTMFYGVLPETGQELTIPDIPADIMKIFLRFLYSGKVQLDHENVTALLYCAKKYSVGMLLKNCLHYLQSEINSSNVCTIMEQAHLFDEMQLYEHCLTIILTNLTKVFTDEDQDFQNLCHDCVKTIVKDDRHNAKQGLLYASCYSWAEKQCELNDIEPSEENVNALLGDIVDVINVPAEKVTEVLAHRVERFQQIIGGHIDGWENDNLFDAISFKCSNPIQLTGVILFAPVSRGTIRGNLGIFDSTNACIVKVNTLELPNNESKIVEVKLENPLNIENNKWYTIQQQMSGSRSYFGVKGQREVENNGVKFTFRNSPMDTNHTIVENGQIFGLLYNLSL